MVGETTIDVPVDPPGFQVQVVAPDPVKVEELPEQITVGDADAETVGVVNTFKVIVLVLEHEPLLPVTV